MERISLFFSRLSYIVYGIYLQVLLKGGPYGSYVQLGVDRKGYLPKRASVSQVSLFSDFYDIPIKFCV